MKKTSVFFLFFAFSLNFLAAAASSSGKDINSLSGEAALNARNSLISTAETFLGVPYRYGGTDKTGIDCSGLVYVSFRDSLGITAPRSASGLFAWAEKIPDSELRPGDLLFFATGSNKAATHVGIYTGDKRFINAVSEGPKTGVMYSTLDESYWKRTYIGGGRAIPWDMPNESVNESVSKPVNAQSKIALTWETSIGFFAGAGASWTFGGLTSKSLSLYGGWATQLKIGYKGLIGNPSLQIALEARPEFDNALRVYRLPLTLSLGNDTMQLFGGPAFTFGDPVLRNGAGYKRAFAFLGEAGVSGAIRPISIKSGVLSFYGETAVQPYIRNENEKFSLISNLRANIRVSAGVRYLFLF